MSFRDQVPSRDVWQQVPHYYFHVRDDIDAEDVEGQALPDLAAAREYAIQGIRDLICASVREGHLDLDHFIEIADGSGETVMRVAFRDAVTIAGGA